MKQPQPIWNTCTPKEDVVQGKLTDDQFAAKLMDVVRGKGAPEYLDPKTFLESTYPIKELRNLVGGTSARLSGEGGSLPPAIILQTGFGGGKTHALIALWHLAKNTKCFRGNPLLDGSPLPQEEIKVAALDASYLDPWRGREVDGKETLTLWGDIIYQLTGKLPVDYKDKKRLRTAPSQDLLDRLLPEGPVLIMLDEVAKYLNLIEKDKSCQEQGLLDQAKHFIPNLVRWASQRQHPTVVVLSLAESSDAWATDTVEAENLFFKGLTEDIHSDIVREGRILKLASEGKDVANIVRHRLFKSWDEDAAYTGGFSC